MKISAIKSESLAVDLLCGICVAADERSLK